MDADAIRTALRCDRPGCACQRPNGNMHCPAHPDEHPSLKVDQADDGRVLVHCFAGCTQEAVIKALQVRGLWTGFPPSPKALPIFFQVARFIERHVILPCEEVATAVALWVLLAWVLAAFDVAPYLAVLSPTMRAGKSRLLEALVHLTPRPWLVVQPSPAALFRKVAADTPELLIDEGEALWSKAAGESAEALRGMLNAGHRRGMKVARVVGNGPRMKVVEFETFCMKVVAAIGTLPQTILDRSIILRLKRATPAEVAPVRGRRHRDAVAEAVPIRDALAAWAEAAMPRLQEAAPPAVPPELDGRAQDLWEPLLAVAAECSDAVYAYGWKAALVLSGVEAREDDSPRLRLLRDVQRVFQEHQTDRFGSVGLIDALCLDDSSPWGDWAHGKRITPQALAGLLRPFDIRPVGIRIGQTTPRGYRLEDFADAFGRYLAGPALSPSDSDPQQVQQRSQDTGFGDFEDPQQKDDVAPSENGATPHGDWIVAPVAVQAQSEWAGEVAAGGLDLLATPEDLGKGSGLGQAILRVGEARAWANVPYAPGRAITAGKRAWLTFVRANPVEELGRAWEGLA